MQLQMQWYEYSRSGTQTNNNHKTYLSNVPVLKQYTAANVNMYFCMHINVRWTTQIYFQQCMCVCKFFSIPPVIIAPCAVVDYSVFLQHTQTRIICQMVRENCLLYTYSNMFLYNPMHNNFLIFILCIRSECLCGKTATVSIENHQTNRLKPLKLSTIFLSVKLFFFFS